MHKHWIIYRLPRKLKNRRGNDMEWGDIAGVYDVSLRATEIEAQKLAQASAGYCYAVLEVNNVFTTDVPAVIHKELDEAPAEEPAEVPDFGNVAIAAEAAPEFLR